MGVIPAAFQMKSRVVDAIRPVMGVLPVVVPPERQLPFRDRVLWSVIVLFIFLVCSNLPLYGVPQNITSDPFYGLRVILATSRGTLMELGIMPLVTSNMLVQYLSGTRIISVDKNSAEDRRRLEGLQKLVSIGLTLLAAVAYTACGMYGDVGKLGTGNGVLIVLQLFIAGVVVLFLDEMLQKGYGVGSGTQLFMTVNVCETIIWKAFSPKSWETPRGNEFEGCVLAFFHLLISRSNKIMAVWDAFNRPYLPNLTQLIATALIFAAIIYFLCWRTALPIKYQRYRATENTYPIKLFYTGNMPIILQTCVLSNVYLVSQMVYRLYPENALIKLLGTWSTDSESAAMESGSVRATGGLIYYLSPPQSLMEAVFDPFRAVFYVTFVVTLCAIFAKTWIHVAGTSSTHVANYLRDNNMMVKGFRESTMKDKLSRYIPTHAVLGGMIIGVLTVLADFLGALGSGTGILMAVTLLYQYYEMTVKENQSSNQYATILS
uniref:Translocon Sec61/SecY plug domain-containing protein n=1 Tax=Pinguiococcus pyrenoidosus TaxID=172671 RepID=A0A7R9U700_9STRA